MLTLLALLAGVAAQFSTAQARIRAEGASEIGAFAAVIESERAAVARPATFVPSPGHRRSERPCLAAATRYEAVCMPSVLPGVDRARE